MALIKTISSKKHIYLVLILCILTLHVSAVFTDKLASCFVGGVDFKHVEIRQGSGNLSLVFKKKFKFAWASTRKEENGTETYEGRHYLRCYKEGLFDKNHGDTGRWPAPDNRGFYLEQKEKTDVTYFPAGGFKAKYGIE